MLRQLLRLRRRSEQQQSLRQLRLLVQVQPERLRRRDVRQQHFYFLQALQFLLLLWLQSLQLLLLERVSAAPRGLLRPRGAQKRHLLHTMEGRRDRE